MYKTKDVNYLVLKLKQGVRYEERAGKSGYNPRQELTRFRFQETEQKFDLSSFKFKREDESLFKSNYQMLNLKQLEISKDSVVRINDSIQKTTFNIVKPYLKIYYQTSKYKTAKFDKNLDF